MKKFRITMLALLTMLLVLTGCAAKEGDGGSNTDTEDKLKIVAIVNGTLGDKSFFDSLNEGMNTLKEKHNNIEVKVIETGFDETKWEPAVIDASEEDWDIIIAGTWQMADYVSKVAEQFPDKKYIVFDTTVDFTDGKNKNVYTMEYKQNEGSYLAGAVAATLSKTGKIGYVGGLDIPVINDFLVGYIRGAQHVNPDIKVASSYVGNFADTGKAKELGFAQQSLGVDVIFPAASTAGNGALEAAKEKGLYGIGVDSDQALLYKEANDETMASLIVTSVLKEVGNSVIRAVELEMEGKLTWGQGEILGIKEGAIGIAKNEYYDAVVSAETKALVDELTSKIESGEIVVDSAFGLSAEQLNEIRNSVKP